MKKSTAAHERHDFGDAGRILYDFFWGEFADWYIEAAKARLYGQDPQAAQQTRQVLAQIMGGCCVRSKAPKYAVQDLHSSWHCLVVRPSPGTQALRIKQATVSLHR